MSDDGIVIDALAGLPDNVSESTAREHIATLVKGNAVSVEAANSALTAKGFALLNPNSKEVASVVKEALTRDSNFMARYVAGDPEAVAKMFRADINIVRGKGDLLDRETVPASDSAYDGMRREIGTHFDDPKAYDTYATELTGLASSIGMPGENARSLTEDHFAAIRETAGMSPDEAKAWGDRETAVLEASIGEGAEAKLTEASKVLSQKSGRKLDLSNIVKFNGARVAINLFFQSQVLSTKRR